MPKRKTLRRRTPSFQRVRRMEGTGETGVFVGLDVSRKSVVATALDPLGRRLSQGKLGATPEAVLDFLQKLPGPKHVALEAGSYRAPLFEAAASVSASVVLSNPLRTRLIADASLKTDRVDSEALATLLRLNVTLHESARRGRLSSVCSRVHSTKSG